MLSVCFFLHAYQPSTQFPELLKVITNESYKPLLSLLEEFSACKLTVNIGGSLLDLWNQEGESGIISRWKNLIDKGTVEIVGSAKYHPLLPKLPASEIKRQITLQKVTLEKYFGSQIQPQGFFPPEMAYDKKVGEVVTSEGYSWILLDQSADPNGKSETTVYPRSGIQKVRGLNLKIVYRDPFLSHKIAFAQIRTLTEFLKALEPFKKTTGYLTLAMDAETFGWHRPGQTELLKEILRSSQKGALGAELLTVSEICRAIPETGEIDSLPSTWGTTVEDAKAGRIFPRWDNPGNEIHQKQWELFNLAVSVAGDELESSKARKYLDQGVQSDQFWWASGNPCWHPMMVNQGSELLQKAIEVSSKSTAQDIKKAETLCQEITRIGRLKYGNKPVAC
jgi:alpha-amylase/alpha-mannosidase (GH57 family)